MSGNERNTRYSVSLTTAHLGRRGSWRPRAHLQFITRDYLTRIREREICVGVLANARVVTYFSA